MNGTGLLKGLGITFKHFFQKPITEQYPEEMPKLADRYRGCLQFDFKKCIACGLCVNTCPNTALSVNTEMVDGKKKLMSYKINLQYCMFCNLCVEACPKNALYFNKNFELSKYNREDLAIIYERPEGLEDEAPAGDAEQPSKEQLQVTAFTAALQNNPQKLLSTFISSEEDVNILSAVLQNQTKIIPILADMIVKDKEKAAQFAGGLIAKEKKARQDAEKGGDE